MATTPNMQSAKSSPRHTSRANPIAAFIPPGIALHPPRYPRHLTGRNRLQPSLHRRPPHLGKLCKPDLIAMHRQRPASSLAQ